MTLENCVKCQYHIRFQAGYVVCTFWKQNEQHVINQGGNGTVYVVGCSKDNK